MCVPILPQVIENCPVTGVQVSTDDLGVKRVRGVETPFGTIETSCLVNCAGQHWTRAYTHTPTHKHTYRSITTLTYAYPHGHACACLSILKDM